MILILLIVCQRDSMMEKDLLLRPHDLMIVSPRTKNRSLVSKRDWKYKERERNERRHSRSPVYQFSQVWNS